MNASCSINLLSTLNRFLPLNDSSTRSKQPSRRYPRLPSRPCQPRDLAHRIPRFSDESGERERGRYRRRATPLTMETTRKRTVPREEEKKERSKKEELWKRNGNGNGSNVVNHQQYGITGKSAINQGSRGNRIRKLPA